MKKNLIVIALCLFAFEGISQVQTLFNRARVVGAFGGPIVEFSEINGESITASGGGGGLIIDDFFIGGYGMGSFDIKDLTDDNEEIKMDLGHGGFWIGYTFRSHKLVHIFASTKLGWGGLDINIDETGYSAVDNIFVTTPEVGIELNVFRWFKIAGTAGYRNVSGVNNNVTGKSNEDFSGLTGTLTFRFGGFGDWRRAKRDRRDRDRYDD